MRRSEITEAVWWAIVFVAVAIVVAAGVRIVAWITEGVWSEEVWRAAAALLIASLGGGTALTALRYRSRD